MIKLFSFFPGYKRYSAHFLYVFATYKTSIDFIFITSLGQIFTHRTGEGHPGQFNRTPAQRTFSSFTICLIPFFKSFHFRTTFQGICASSLYQLALCDALVIKDDVHVERAVGHRGARGANLSQIRFFPITPYLFMISHNVQPKSNCFALL